MGSGAASAGPGHAADRLNSETLAALARQISRGEDHVTADQLAAIDALDTGVRGGPEPEDITRETFGLEHDAADTQNREYWRGFVQSALDAFEEFAI